MLARHTAGSVVCRSSTLDHALGAHWNVLMPLAAVTACTRAMEETMSRSWTWMALPGLVLAASAAFSAGERDPGPVSRGARLEEGASAFLRSESRRGAPDSAEERASEPSDPVGLNAAGEAISGTGGAISGTVRDAATTLPLTNVRVGIYNAFGSSVSKAKTPY